MPLSKGQQLIIESTIAHLLDFSTDQPEFEKEELALIAAINNPVEKSHPFYWIRECLVNPSECFRRLEQQGPSVTIGEVQKYVVDFIDLRLRQSKYKCVFWNRNKILNTLQTENTDKPFVTKQAPIIDTVHPYELTNVKEKIFIGMMGTDISYGFDDDDQLNTYYQVYVKVTVTCDEQTYTEKITLSDKISSRQFPTDQQQTAFIEELKPEALAAAEKYAAQCAVMYLDGIGMIDHSTSEATDEMDDDQDENDDENNKDQDDDVEMADEDADEEFPYSDAVKLIITNQFYLDQLQLGNILFYQVTQLSNTDRDIEKAEYLTHPTIIDILRKGLDGFNFSDLVSFSPAALKIITHPTFYSLLLLNKINKSDIIYTSSSRAKFLTFPPIANLISTGKLPLLYAKKLPAEFKSIASDYYDFFSKLEKVNWQPLFNLKKQHYALLQNKNMLRLISNSIINIVDVPKLSVSPFMIAILNRCPRLFHWLEPGIISFDTLSDYNANDFFKLYADIYGRRFYHLLINTPFKFDGKIDTIKILMDELPVAASEWNYGLNDLKQSITEKLITLIKSEITAYIPVDKRPYELNIMWYQFLAIIEISCQRSPIDWLDCFSNLIDSAKLVQKQIAKLPSKGLTLFANSSKHAQEVTNFCDNLITLSPLCPVNSVENVPVIKNA